MGFFNLCDENIEQIIIERLCTGKLSASHGCGPLALRFALVKSANGRKVQLTVDRTGIIRIAGRPKTPNRLVIYLPSKYIVD